jgi:hypothetical protein
MNISTPFSTSTAITGLERIPHRPGKPGNWSHPLLAGLALSVLAGCASAPAGSAGYDAFLADAAPKGLSGARDAALAAQCFEDRATFLPLSTFSRDAAMNAFTYRLRVSDLWFEEVRIKPEGTGSRAEWRVAPQLDAKWLGQFERDRMAPLRQCLGP